MIQLQGLPLACPTRQDLSFCCLLKGSHPSPSPLSGAEGSPAFLFSTKLLEQLLCRLLAHGILCLCICPMCILCFSPTCQIPSSSPNVAKGLEC